MDKNNNTRSTGKNWAKTPFTKEFVESLLSTLILEIISFTWAEIAESCYERQKRWIYNTKHRYLFIIQLSKRLRTKMILFCNWPRVLCDIETFINLPIKEWLAILFILMDQVHIKFIYSKIHLTSWWFSSLQVWY